MSVVIQIREKDEGQKFIVRFELYKPDRKVGNKEALSTARRGYHVIS